MSDFYSFAPNAPFAHCQTFTRFGQTRLSRIVRLLLVSAKLAFRALSDFYSFPPNSPFAHCQTFTRFGQIHPCTHVRLSLVSAKPAFRVLSAFYSFPPNSPLVHCQPFTRFRQMRLHPFDRFDFLYLLISTSASSTDIITRYSPSKVNNRDKNFWYHHI